LLEETGGPGENHWPVASWDSIIWFNPLQLCACPKPGPEFPSHKFMSSSFFYSMSWGKRWLFVFFYIQWVEPEVRGDCSSFLYIKVLLSQIHNTIFKSLIRFYPFLHIFPVEVKSRWLGQFHIGFLYCWPRSEYGWNTARWTFKQ
jgi:hypothetical protein